MGRKQLLVGTAILAGANILTKCMGFFYRIFMSNYIGAEGMGLYQLILPLYTLAWSITAGGFTITVSRLTAREHARGENGSIGRIVKQSASLCLLLSILLSCVLFWGADWIALHILQEPRTALSLRLLAFAIPFMSVGSCLRGFFQGLQQMTVPAFSQILEQLLRIGAIYLLAGIFVPRGLEYACFAAVWGIVLGEAGAFCYTFFHYLHKKTPLEIHTQTCHFFRRLFFPDIIHGSSIGSYPHYRLPALHIGKYPHSPAFGIIRKQFSRSTGFLRRTDRDGIAFTHAAFRFSHGIFRFTGA